MAEWMEAVEDVRAGRVDTEVWRGDVLFGRVVGRIWQKVSADDAEVGVTIYRMRVGEQDTDAIPPDPVHNQPDTPPIVAV